VCTGATRPGFALICTIVPLLVLPPTLASTAEIESGRSHPDGRDLAALWTSWPVPRVYKITLNSDDGTECDSVWYANGTGSGLDCIGKDCSSDFLAGFRFAVPDLDQGMEVEFARLLVSAQGGHAESEVKLSIWGVNEDSPATFSALRRPSYVPRTDDSVTWCIREVWPETGAERALYWKFPDIACLVNEVLARPGWGEGDEGKQLAFVIGQCGCAAGEANYLRFEDFWTEMEVRDQAMLEIYRTVEETFVGKPMLGRVTDNSVVINAMSLVEIDVYAEYGLCSGVYDFSTAPLLDQASGQPVEVEIYGLIPDTKYFYRLRYREAGVGPYLEWMEGSFHTERPRGGTFVFAVQADAHPHLISGIGGGPVLPGPDWALYERTLSNIAASAPDFLIDLGDFVDIECIAYSRNVLSLEEAEDRYLEQREHIDKFVHSIPFYLVLGNHEAEEGWRAANEDDSLEVWGTLARKALIPNPQPDGFYTGSEESTACCGVRENYYSWEWGDALFVVIDPFWNTVKVPHWYSEYPRDGGGWDWTLGLDQYEWFYDTLHNSSARWKFVFSHHEAGGVLTENSFYGRGGIEAAKCAVAGRPSFEWGGEDNEGNYIFGEKREGWEHGPIHDIMANEGVNIFFHGHDHVYVCQTLDGVIYQACPRPKDSSYSDGFYDDGHYVSGVKRNNSGHIQVTVSPEDVEVAYIRSVLEDDEPLLEDSVLIYNGDVSHTYSVSLAGTSPRHPGIARPSILGVHPNPFRASTKVDVFTPETAVVTLTMYDVRGRNLGMLFSGLLPPGRHGFAWDRRSGVMRASPGIYFCRLDAGRCADVRKVVLLR
jgi:3',5'-cyclic AMP phosphodiesterase CpdA